MVLLLAAVLFVAVPTESPNCVLLQFSTDSCPSCTQMQPVVDALIDEGWIVRHVDARDQAAMAQRYRVTQVPTMVVLEAGNEVDRIIGAVGYAELRERLVTNLSRNADQLQRLANLEMAEQANQTFAHRDGNHSPTIRGQSPMVPIAPILTAGASLDGASASQMSNSLQSRIGPDPIASTVRIRIEDPVHESIGTGTMIDTNNGETLVITCGHLFRDAKNARIFVDYWIDGQLQTAHATLVDFQANETDMGLISFRPMGKVSTSPVIHPSVELQQTQDVYSYGCDAGANPSRRNSRIAKLNRFLGPQNIEVTGAPVQGRSGGGLFDVQGNLIGICYAADNELDEGLYSGPQVIYQQLQRIGMERLASARNNPASRVGSDGFVNTNQSAGRNFQQSGLDFAASSLGNVATPPRVTVIIDSGNGQQVVDLSHAPSDLLQEIQRHAADHSNSIRR